MGEGRRVESLLAAGKREEARAALAAADGAEADGYLTLLTLWTGARHQGPGHATAGLAAWTPPPEGHPDRARCLALAAALRASEALRTGRTRALLAHAVEAARAAPPDAPWLAFLVGSVLQSAYRMTGDAAAADRALELLGAVGDRTDLPRLAVQARALAGSLHMLRGRFHRSEDLLTSSLELADAAGLEEEAERAMSLQFRGYLRTEWNRLDEARDLLTRAVALAERAQGRGVLSGSYRMLMEVALARNEPQVARRWLGRLEDLLGGPASDRNREWLAAVRARFQVATGDLRGAAATIRARGWRPGDLAGAGPDRLLGRLGEVATLLDVLGALERWGELAPLAVRVQVVSGEAGRLWFAVRAGGWLAAALEAEGRSDEADGVLAGLLPVVDEEGYVRVLADLGAPLLPVLERVGAAHRASGALSRILAATRLEVSWRRPRPSLTPREAEILGLLARGDSTRTIAAELGIASATVKTHLHHLYRKLDVTSRTQALARAESLALL